MKLKGKKHDGGRARNSDEFVCLQQIPLTKYLFPAIAKKQVSKCTHMFLV